MKVMEIYRQCPMCGNAAHVFLLGDEVDGYMRYYMHRNIHIQKALPNTARDVREFLMTGYCGECQELIFGNKKSGQVKEGISGILDCLDIDEIESRELLDAYIEEANALISKYPRAILAIKETSLPEKADIVETGKYLVAYK